MGLRFLGWATWNWRYELLIDVVYYYSIIKLVIHLTSSTAIYSSIGNIYREEFFQDSAVKAKGYLDKTIIR